MADRKNYNPQLRQFWNHGLNPITGLKDGAENTRVNGSGLIKLMQIPKITYNKFKNRQI